MSKKTDTQWFRKAVEKFNKSNLTAFKIETKGDMYRLVFPDKNKKTKEK